MVFLSSSRVGDHREKGDVKALVWYRVLNILGVSTRLQVCRGPIAFVSNYTVFLPLTFLVAFSRYSPPTMDTVGQLLAEGVL